MFHRDAVPDSAELLALMAIAPISSSGSRAACKIWASRTSTSWSGRRGAAAKRGIVRKLARVCASCVPTRPDPLVREGDGSPMTTHHRADCDEGDSVRRQVDPATRIHRIAWPVFYFAEAAPPAPQRFEGDGGYYVNVYIDTSDVIQKKFAAMECW